MVGFCDIVKTLYRLRKELEKHKFGPIHKKVLAAANRGEDSVLVYVGIPGTKSGDEMQEVIESPGLLVTKVSEEGKGTTPLGFLIQFNVDDMQGKEEEVDEEVEEDDEDEEEEDEEEDEVEEAVEEVVEAPAHKRRVRFLKAMRR